MSWELEHHKNLYEIPATNIVFVANKLQKIHDLRLHLGGEQGKMNILLVGVDHLDALVHTGCPFCWWPLGCSNEASRPAFRPARLPHG